MPSAASSSSPVALVTGASGIIGPAIVRTLREQGWRVAAADRNAGAFSLYEDLFEKLEADGIFHADLSDPNACKNLIQEVHDRLGPVKCLINNAAFNISQDIASLDPSVLLKMFAVNFFAPLWLLQSALPGLVAQKGSVINISSVLVHELRKGNLPYSCTKAALEKATECLALDLREQEVRCNAIRIGRVPGYHFMLDALKQLPREKARKMVQDLLPLWIETAKKREQAGGYSVISPEDVAHMVAFLADEKSRHLNGQLIALNGGPIDAAPPKTLQHSGHLMISEWLKKNE